MHRRKFTILSAGAAASLAGAARAVAGVEGFFSLRQERDQWWLSTPDGERFFSLGLHGPEQPQKAQDEIAEWGRHYGRDAGEWILDSAADDLQRGGFNSRTAAGVDQSPYCHLVPFSGVDLWNRRDQQVNYLHSDWDEWCDHVARGHCQQRANDRNLIGYFYSGSPCWLHAQPRSDWRGPLYDPAMLTSPSGRRDLRILARR